LTAENEAVEGPLPRSRGRWFTRPQKLTIITVSVAAPLGMLVLSNWLPATHRDPDDKVAAHVSGPGVPLKQPAPAPATALPMPTATPIATLQHYAAPTLQTPNLSKATSAPVLSYAAADVLGPGPGGRVRAGPLTEDERIAAAEAKAEEDPLTASLHPSRLSASMKAHRIKNPDKIINRGEPIPCSLQTAINSQLPGFVTCITGKEIRSLSGRATLMDRGTKLFGEVKYGIKRGQDRLLILWTWATIPMQTRRGVEYVDVELNSPAAGPLGEPGVEGDVNHHYAQRFLAAGLFTIIEAAPQLLQAAIQNNNSGTGNSYTNFTSSPAQSLAGTVLQETIHIPDVLTRNQGANVMVMVARPLDFSDVVDFELVNK
jgi:type IV secretion system protein VirB10